MVWRAPLAFKQVGGAYLGIAGLLEIFLNVPLNAQVMLPFIFKQHDTENTGLQQVVAHAVVISYTVCDLLACCFSGVFPYELAVPAVSISYHF